MVRFIMLADYRAWANATDLHSNMVRFIMKEYNNHIHAHPQFTFQYG